VAAAVHPGDQLAERALSVDPFPPAPGGTLDRIVHGEEVNAAENIEESAGYRTRAEFREMADRSGYRSLLNVALRKEGALLGVITIFRKEAGTFSEKQIALLQNFAAHAVIAMENARLLTETHEALVQQTATAEVLQVINSSPGDRTPVFEATLEKARILCGAAHGSLSLYGGERFRAVAINTRSQELADRMRQGFLPSDFPYLRPLLDGARLVHVPDLVEFGNPFRARTALFVPLRKDDALLCLISTVRLEIRPFSDNEIALVENFAAQAVIAMENARLITETREALEQQTATSEVLQVINSSPGDLSPVFEAMLEKGIRLCDAVQGALWLIEGERARVAAARRLTPEFLALLRERGGPTPPLQRVMRGERVIHYLDTKGSGLPFVEEALAADVRTLLWVALEREGAPLGAFANRRRVSCSWPQIYIL
jgi:GAF domain-containing protein